MIDQLLLDIRKHQKAPLTLLGIDGPGGVGKTTLAEELKRNLKDLQIVHMDDFDVPRAQKMSNLSSNRPVGPDTQWYRVIQEVILPLRAGEIARFVPYNRSRDAYSGEAMIKPCGIVVIEGVFAIRRELFSHFDFSIWVECSFKTRVKRALDRDGEVARSLWEKDWLPMEEKYQSIYKPHEYADFIYRTD